MHHPAKLLLDDQQGQPGGGRVGRGHRDPELRAGPRGEGGTAAQRVKQKSVCEREMKGGREMGDEEEFHVWAW